ncbi:hypothetical protein [Lysobacter sp. CA199]
MNIEQACLNPAWRCRIVGGKAGVSANRGGAMAGRGAFGKAKENGL